MRALQSFPVRASLPDRLTGLLELAHNLRWSWDEHSIEVFRWVDATKWEEAEHNPVRLLGLVPRARLEALAADDAFTSFLDTTLDELNRYLTQKRWYQSQPGAPRCVAYFSPEFGLAEALPVYSGGLGVLAGDHLKSASDLGVPLVAVGLLYARGYFRQYLNQDGWQQEHYPRLDPHALPVRLVTDDSGAPIRAQVDLAGAITTLQLWQAQVGRVPLYLLDADVDGNAPPDREVTDRLYGGNVEHRLRQEIILGVGGCAALEAIGITPEVFHLNEGHAGFLALERIRSLVEGGLTFDEASEAARPGMVFTTHTPVPAGIDLFPRELMEKYFAHLAERCGVTFDRLMEIGRPDPGDTESPFNMAVMGLRLSGAANAVSKLHGAVSRRMFGHLWPETPHIELPIGSVTNGVHARTWVGTEMADLYERYLGPEWADSPDAEVWERARSIPDEELFRARERARENLVGAARARLRTQLVARGSTASDVEWTEELFDARTLTIGFARRFAEYKRATLILHDAARLKAMLVSRDRPVQIVFAGKAHPHDDRGKELIRRIVHFAGDHDVRTRLVFLEDYDMGLARAMYQGVDVWLNNPRRPLEACGTSGMKAALNGALNLSVLDGWWDELFTGENGWAIGRREEYTDIAYQDQVEASALYDLLERQITPAFYDRRAGRIPRAWTERMKASISSLGAQIRASRMVRDYVRDLYTPAGERSRRLAADNHARAKALAAWKERARDAWASVGFGPVEPDTPPEGVVGGEVKVRAFVRLGDLAPEDVLVQLAHGGVDRDGEIVDPELIPLTVAAQEGDYHRFECSFTTRAAGLYGFTVRVLAAHDDLGHPHETGLIAWADRPPDQA